MKTANIYEDRLNGLWGAGTEFKKVRDDIMQELYGEDAEEKMRRTDFYLSKWTERRGEIGEKVLEWEDIDCLCKSEREDNGSGQETAFVNVMISNFEGQVSAMTNYNISASLKGRGVGDDMFVKTAEPIISFLIEQCNIRQLVKNAGRKYIKYGNAFITVGWDADAFDGMGLPKIKVRGLSEILLDGRVTEPEDIGEMEYYIEEVGQKSILWAEREYGEDIAKAIQTGNAVQDFAEAYNMDDNSSFTLIRVWTKANKTGNMQMLQMSACGILLEESDENEPYYTRVFNRLPVFYAGLYPSEGEFYHYGDGKLLKPIQELFNKLFDECMLALKFSSQGRTFADPNSKLDPDEFAENDPSRPTFVDNPNQNILVTRGTGINDGIYNVLSLLLTQVQEVTRFSTLMTGQQGSRKTATEAGILMQQGATGIDDKKGDISKMLSDAVLYAFALCLENWNTAVALRVADNPDDFVWVDPEQLTRVPKMIPASRQYQEDWKKKQPKKDKKDLPKWMMLEVDNEQLDELGKPIGKTPATGQIAIDLTLSIGEGMPNNKVSMFNIIQALSQMQMVDEVTGQPVSIMSVQKVKGMVSDILGITLDDVKDDGDKMVESKTATQPINQDANVPNANVSGQLGGMNV